MNHPSACPRPANWKLLLALTLVYLSWGTTYLAIQEGVKTLPPGLFGGVRVGLAGLLLLAYLVLSRQVVRVPWNEAAWLWGVGSLMFVAGNGLITLAEKTVPSGVTSVLAATMPLWLALFEAASPRGERLSLRAWTGLLLGLTGVALLWVGKQEQNSLFNLFGPLLVLGSTWSWALGSFLSRNRRLSTPPVTAAAYQMFLGGGSLALVGLAFGEARQLRPEHFTPGAVGAFFYLLLVGSLIGFVAYTWLLRHVSAALAGTHAYVNPVVALVAGWLLAQEEITPAVVGGMVVILTGVALVRMGGSHRRAGPAAPPPDARQALPREGRPVFDTIRRSEKPKRRLHR